MRLSASCPSASVVHAGTIFGHNGDLYRGQSIRRGAGTAESDDKILRGHRADLLVGGIDIGKLYLYTLHTEDIQGFYECSMLGEIKALPGLSGL